MGKNTFMVFALVAVATIALITLYLLENGPVPQPVSFEVNNRTYPITNYADTPAQLDRGLMNATVTNSTFMLFYFHERGIYPFWMKNTYSQLDMIWLNYSSSDANATIVYMANATPCISYDKSQNSCTIYIPTAYANYVLETKSGFVEENNLHVGSKIKFIFK